jgi:hypothetical protein
MYRVLRPGGRVAVSDIALKQPLPAAVSADLLAYVGCVAGAVLIDDYVRQLKEAGFQAVQVVDTRKDLNAYAKVGNSSGGCTPPAAESSGCGTLPQAPASTCCGGMRAGDADAVHGGLAELLARYDVNDYAASVQVYAVKGR